MDESTLKTDHFELRETSQGSPTPPALMSAPSQEIQEPLALPPDATLVLEATAQPSPIQQSEKKPTAPFSVQLATVIISSACFPGLAAACAKLYILTTATGVYSRLDWLQSVGFLDLTLRSCIGGLVGGLSAYGLLVLLTRIKAPAPSALVLGLIFMSFAPLICDSFYPIMHGLIVLKVVLSVTLFGAMCAVDCLNKVNARYSKASKETMPS